MDTLWISLSGRGPGSITNVLILHPIYFQVHESVVKLLEKNSSESDAAAFLCSSPDATKAAAR